MHEGVEVCSACYVALGQTLSHEGVEGSFVCLVSRQKSALSSYLLPPCAKANRMRVSMSSPSFTQGRGAKICHLAKWNPSRPTIIRSFSHLAKPNPSCEPVAALPSPYHRQSHQGAGHFGFGSSFAHTMLAKEFAKAASPMESEASRAPNLTARNSRSHSLASERNSPLGSPDDFNWR